jgi:nucleoside-diphosphate-sugar epimerase
MLVSSANINYDTFYNFSSSSVTLQAETFYSATKKGAEHICDAFRMKYDKNIVNIRPYSVYGEGEAEFRFIPTVIRNLLNDTPMVVDEDATHDWIYIQDFIDALLDGNTEIGTGVKTTNKEIVNTLEKISGKKLKYTTSKLRSYDNEDWYCKQGVKHMSLEEGLTKTFEYYAKQRFKKQDNRDIISK